MSTTTQDVPVQAFRELARTEGKRAETTRRERFRRVNNLRLFVKIALAMEHRTVYIGEPHERLAVLRLFVPLRNGSLAWTRIRLVEGMSVDWHLARLRHQLHRAGLVLRVAREEQVRNLMSETLRRGAA